MYCFACCHRKAPAPTLVTLVQKLGGDDETNLDKELRASSEEGPLRLKDRKAKRTDIDKRNAHRDHALTLVHKSYQATVSEAGGKNLRAAGEAWERFQNNLETNYLENDHYKITLRLVHQLSREVSEAIHPTERRELPRVAWI